MILKIIDEKFSVCRSGDPAAAVFADTYCFLCKTDEEISLVCPTSSVPGHTLAREDGWRAFRIEGVLDFSLIGILAGISGILAENKIGIFVVSTYNTDYVLTKEESFERAMALLARHGYTVLPDNPSHSTDDNSLRNAEREGVAE